MFTTTEDFEAWQQDELTPIRIISVAPIVLSMGADMREASMNADINVGVFVTYYSEVSDE